MLWMCSLVSLDVLVSHYGFYYTASSETDEIYKICSVIGTPNHKTWAVGMKLAAYMNFRFLQVCLLMRLATFQAL